MADQSIFILKRFCQLKKVTDTFHQQPICKDSFKSIEVFGFLLSLSKNISLTSLAHPKSERYSMDLNQRVPLNVDFVPNNIVIFPWLIEQHLKYYIHEFS